MTEKCGHGCGRDAEKTSSGHPECWPCWNRRKLDLPAAEHWARVSAEFLSNVDMYDVMTYLPERCGLGKDDMQTMIQAVRKVQTYSAALLKAGYREVVLPSPE